MRNVILGFVTMALACGNVDAAGPRAESSESRESREANAGQCARPPLEPCPGEDAAVRVFADADCSWPVVRMVDTCPAVSSVTAHDGRYVAGEIVEPDASSGLVTLYMHTNCGCVPFVMPSNATYYLGKPASAS